MYTEHFGLKQRPFRRNAVGTDVFIGPQTAATMSAIKKALAVDDAVIAISGPVGVGKTTVVKRALGTVGEHRIVITIGRLQLGYDEVIELLIAGLGAQQMPKSTVQRFALFRRLLHQHAERGNRVMIAVEDANTLGIPALAELEALTAEDSGASSGASLVLMGATGLPELLRHPELARLKQRIRLRQELQPLEAPELRGYLKHCFRLSGGEFDEAFDAGADQALYRFSGGIPRVCNSIIDQVLESAAEQGLSKVPVALIERTAAEEIGLTVEHSVAEIKAALTRAEVEKTEAEARAAADLGPDERHESVEVCESSPADGAAPAVQPPLPEEIPEAAGPPDAPAAEVQEEEEDDIPELIQDTLPELAVLAPELAPEPDDAPAPETSSQPPEPDQAPARAPAAAAAPPEQPAAPLPDWERDPTFAELRPDLDALERAMAMAQGDDDADYEAPAVARVRPAAANPPELVPEITLDREIQAKIDEATEALRQTETDIPMLVADDENQSLEATLTEDEKVQPLAKPVREPAVAGNEARTTAPPPARPAASDADKAELERIATQLSQAKSLEDMDDKLAETLFGEEFSMLAAEVAASAEPPSSANEEFELSLEDEPEPIVAESAEPPAPPVPPEPARQVAAGPGTAPAGKGLDPKASERLATVRALNNGTPRTAAAQHAASDPEAIVLSSGTESQLTDPDKSGPTSIEEQMNTSMTQTLKALSARNTPVSNDDDDGGKKGLFSRFRRS